MIVKRKGKYLSRPADGHGGRLPGQTFETKREAEDHEAKCKREVRGGTYIAPKSIPTFEAKSIDWFATLAGRRDGTISNYRGVLDNHLLPKFRNVRLDQIDTQTVERFRAEIDAKTGRGNLKMIMSVLTQILRMAERHDQIRSVATDRLPRLLTKTAELVDDGETKDADTLDPEKVLNPIEVKLMLDRASPGFDRAFLTTCALTGCRDGELLALRWSEVDLGGGKISIERSLSWSRVLPARALDGTRPAAGPMQPRFYPPKTTTSKRTLVVAPQLVSLLRAWKLQCPPGKDDLVFPAPDGRPMHRTAALKRLRAVLRRAGLRKVTLHSLRHSFASALIANGSSVVEVAALLGHSNATITLRVYSHFFPSAPSGSVAKLASAILGDGAARHQKDTLRVA